jgi:hypothetical protein
MKIGDVVLMKDGLPLPANTPEAAGFIKQAGGFAFFGDASLDAIGRWVYCFVWLLFDGGRVVSACSVYRVV